MPVVGYSRTVAAAGATLYDLDYGGGVADAAATATAGFTFARTGTGWVDGVAFSANVPRIAVSSGLYLEGARTNLFIQSAALGSFTLAGTDTVTADVEAAPDGNTTVDEWASPGAGATRTLTITTTNALNYSLSSWARLVSGVSQLQFRYSGSATGTTGSTFSSLSSTLTRLFTTVLGKSGGGSVTFGWRAATAVTWVARLWGYQVEQADFAGTYIPTSGSSVTRNAETCTASRSAVTAGTALGKARTARGKTSGTAQVLWQRDDGTTGNRLRVYRDGATGAITADATLATSVVATATGPVVADDTALSWGLSFDATGLDLYVTGTGHATSGAPGSWFTTELTTERLGHGVSAGLEWARYLARCQYRTSRLATSPLATAVDAL